MAQVMNFVKKRWLLLAVLAAAVAAVVFGRPYVNVMGQSSEGGKTYTVRAREVKDDLSLSGSIDAVEKATVRFQTSGMMTWVGVKEGDYVNKYQGLASLDQRELKKKLDKYLIAYKKERWDFEQGKDDYDGVQMTDEIRRIMDKSQFDLDSSVIDVELQDIALKYSYLYSPIDGLVTKVSVPYAGTNITPAGAEFEIINPATVYFSVAADQTDVVKIHQGMPGTIELDSYPDDALNGIVTDISFTPKAGETGAVYEVKMSVNDDNSSYRYRLGMTGDASFILGSRGRMLLVPNTYIKTENKQSYVWKRVDGRKEKTMVKTGDIIESSTEITSGLKDGDVIYD